MFIKFPLMDNDDISGNPTGILDDIAELDDKSSEDDNVEDADVEEDDEETSEDDDSSEEVEDEEVEEKEEEEEEKEEDDEEKEETKKEENLEFSVKGLKTSYPDIFKKFPELKDTIYRHREFTKIFGTVEDAVEASEKVQIFDDISSDLTKGDPSGLLGALQGDSLDKFANNFLPALHSKNKELFFQVTDKLVARVLRGAIHSAEKTNDKNLATAVKYISRFAFGDVEVPNFDEKKEERNPEKEEWEKQKQSELRAKFEEIETSVHSVADERLTKIISEGITDDSMSPFVKSAVINGIKDEVDRQIAKDSVFQSQIKSLWKRASRENFSKEAKSRIITAYLARARRIIPAIRSKVHGEVAKQASKNGNDKKKQTTSGITKGKKTIDWKKMSDEDILSGD